MSVDQIVENFVKVVLVQMMEYLVVETSLELNDAVEAGVEDKEKKDLCLMGGQELVC